tara:strand:+ start:503 stop:1585 length:1083 start_codon:yes stop_codon:yes gene_type:complete
VNVIFTNKKPIRCHVELTNHCNAACPMCGRHTVHNKAPYTMRLKPHVNTSSLSIHDIKKIFDDRFFDTYNFVGINMCGNRGDPAASKDLFEICEYLFSKAPELQIKISTNGGLKTPHYWGRLGKMFSKYGNKSRVTFGIDGLKDTNHIYRQNVDFERVIKNAESFINNGGAAFWQFLVFKHNEHQIEEAKILASKMGFEDIFFMHTPRFVHTQTRDGKQTFTWQNKTYTLETADPDFAKKQDTQKFINSNEHEEIVCKAKKQNEFYLDSSGRILPCCWLGNSLDRFLAYRESGDLIMSLYDIEEMNVIENDLVDTLQHDFINKIVPFAWNDLGKNCASIMCKSYCSKKRNLRKQKISKWK